MSENFLKYSSVTYQDILQQIISRVASDPKYVNLVGSPLFDLMTEIFAGTTDLTTFFIQRRAEECFYDTLQLKSSAISLSRMFSYDVARATPAQTKLKIILDGDFSSIFQVGEDNKIQLPFYSKFSINGNDYVLIDTWTFNITPQILSDMITDADEFKLEITEDSFGNDIAITQGVIREKVIEGSTNGQINSFFQKYKIEDLEFSNIYGDYDYFHNKVTQVYVGESKTEATRFNIDRKSLINWETFKSVTNFQTFQKLCLIRTSRDENIEMTFGDDKYASIGARSSKDNIYLQYLATKGSSANAYGVIGNKVDFSGNIYTNAGVNITHLVKFELASNIINGSDLESTDSIKYNSPKMFYTQERIVTKDDYLNFLKFLKSPIVVKNAIAWGEQEERDKQNVFADIKMFNVVFFSVIGSLYDLSKSVYTVKSKLSGYEDSVLDMDYDPDEIQMQSYFNIYIRNTVVNQLKQYTILNYYNKLTSIAANINISALLAKYSSTPAKLVFNYKSEIPKNASNIIGSGSVDVDLSSLTISNTLADVAAIISTALINFNDARANIYDNVNYKKPAFTAYDTNLVYVNSNDKLEIAYTITSPCFAYEFSGDFATTIGFTGVNYYSVAVTETSEISGKIISVVNELQRRSQVNVKNIYISPIIQNFNLTGKVIVSPLVDKESLKTVVTNKLYKWLDLNLDFNVEINSYDLVRLISQVTGVENAIIKIVPDDITMGKNNVKNKYYFSKDDLILKNYTNSNNENNILQVIFEHLSYYLSGYNYSEAFDRFFINSNPDNSIQEYHNLELYQYEVKNYITERSFYKKFVSLLYNALLYYAKHQPEDSDNYILSDGSPNYKRFLGYIENTDTHNYNTDIQFYVSSQTSDFVKVISEIHKDLSYIIRLNMLDLDGNVRKQVDENNKYIRGGYSLGSEIVKLSLEKLNFEYK